MTLLFAVTGIVAWLFAALLAVVYVLTRRRVRRRLESRQLLPYTLSAAYRFKGWLMSQVRRVGLGKASPDIIAAHKAIKLADMKHLRDVMAEMDELPTIVNGKAALRLKSVFELPTARAHKIKSPYTHPMQYPPYLIPGVPARMFYDPREFEWARMLEDAYPVIKQELLNVLAMQGTGFKGYVTEGATRLAGWNTFNFWFFGKKFEENCALCPETTRVLESLPRFEKDHIMFSALNPHARIPPHTGPMNGILRAHLPLIVPDGCYIRVGTEERTWHEGQVLVFDDSFEHEVWNHSDYVRIVLFLNFWHPCFSDAEIKVLEKFRAAYERGPVAMVHAQNQAARRAHDLEAGRVVRAA